MDAALDRLCSGSLAQISDAILTLLRRKLNHAAAITFGQPDGNRHPNVGMLIFEILPTASCIHSVQVPSLRPTFT
jgi:hypothetical protein